MIPITILVEDTTENFKYSCAKGLSIFINTKEQKILMDTGPNSTFIKNAKKLGIDLTQINTLILSHAHRPFNGGLNQFCKINKDAQIVIQNTDFEKYYFVKGKSKKNISPKLTVKNLPQIRMINNPAQITTNSWFIPCTVHNYGTPKKNQFLYRKTPSKFVMDNFMHEGIFVIDDNGELVIFNSCSHNGVINSIESAKQFFPNKRLRSYVGGFHFPFKDNETIPPDDMRNLDEIIDYSKINQNLRFFTGHCTGLPAIEYLQRGIGKNRVLKIQSGGFYTI